MSIRSASAWKAVPHLVATLLAASAPGAAALADPTAETGEAEEEEVRLERPVVLPLETIGWSQQVRRNETRATLYLPFSSRADRLLTGGKLFLEFASGRAALPQGLVVRLNGELIESLRTEDLYREVELEIPSAFLSEHNVLGLELVSDDVDACGEIGQGAWSFLEGGRLELGSMQLPFPADLSRFPLPWIDPAFDRQGEVNLVIAGRPSWERIEIAGHLAAWLGRVGGIPIRFSVVQGRLPPAHAVVLVEDATSARYLGLPAPQGPFLRALAHPGSPHQFLVLEGRSLRELADSAKSLAEGDPPTMQGTEVLVPRRHAPPPSQPYRSVRWAPPAQDLRLPELAEGATRLEHRGARPGTLPLRFRLSPDFFVWPKEWVDFDLVYRIDGHRDTGAPRLDLSLNGTFVGRLPTDGKEGSRRKRIRLQRDHFRGYNEFLVHISYPEGSCGAGEPVVVLEQETTLRLEKARNFAPLPDVKLLAYDGFPFTRHADLSHTVIALPESPTVAEVSSALSWIAWFAAITGEGGTSFTLMRLDALETERPKGDVLAIAEAGSVGRFFDQWGMPVRITARGQTRLRGPAPGAWVEDLSLAYVLRVERLRAQEMLTSIAPELPGILMGVPSPWQEGRVLMLATSPRGGEIPDVVSVQGPARSMHPGGDLFVVLNGTRATFQILPSRPSGEVPL